MYILQCRAGMKVTKQYVHVHTVVQGWDEGYKTIFEASLAKTKEYPKVQTFKEEELFDLHRNKLHKHVCIK